MKQKQHAPRIPLSQVSTADLLQGFDNALQDWIGGDDGTPPLQEPVWVGRYT